MLRKQQLSRFDDEEDEEKKNDEKTEVRRTCIVIVRVEQLTSHRAMFIEKELKEEKFYKPQQTNLKINFRDKTGFF